MSFECNVWDIKVYFYVLHVTPNELLKANMSSLNLSKQMFSSFTISLLHNILDIRNVVVNIILNLKKWYLNFAKTEETAIF